MKTEGYKFPTFKETDAMFLADTAPSWKDGDRCHRCRTMFTLINRKVRNYFAILPNCENPFESVTFGFALASLSSLRRGVLSTMLIS